MNRRALLLALALASATACQREEKASHALPALDARHEPLRARFDQDAAGPRLLILASPTSADGIRRVDTVLDEVVKQVAAPDLRVYVVWQPVLPDDDEKAARRVAQRFSEPRLVQYWDPDRALGWTLGKALGLPPRGRGGWGVAWDVFLVYARGAGWQTVTEPALWMQQLDDVPPSKAPKLDAGALKKVVEGLVGR